MLPAREGRRLRSSSVVQHIMDRAKIMPSAKLGCLGFSLISVWKVVLVAAGFGIRASMCVCSLGGGALAFGESWN